ncbi:MAG: FecR protein, partial [Verrucomicrobia bacterium]
MGLRRGFPRFFSLFYSENGPRIPCGAEFALLDGPLIMKFKSTRLCLLLWPLSVAPAYSAAIQNLTFTDVVKDVIIIDVASKKESPAKAGDLLVPPNVLKTGPDSRAELIAEDKTVTRVGANTIFSVEADSRDVNLTQGSVLFNSPKGKGGGRIKSAGATASVLGTTLIVGANPSGGFKVMLLEGKGQVTGAKGGSSKLSPGQMSFALPGKPPTAPLNFALKGNVSGSKLVGGFSKPLASIAKIEAAVNVQQAKIASGGLETTDLAIGDQPGVATQVDPALVRAAEAQIKELQVAILEAIGKIAQTIREQRAAEEETSTNSSRVPSDDFLAALPYILSLPSLEAPNPPLIAPEKLIFGVDGSGLETSGKNAGSKMITSVPRGQTALGNPLIATLLSKDITLTLPALKSDRFLLGPGETKDASAIVALRDLKINGSIDFTGFDNLRTFPDLSGAATVNGSKTVIFPEIGGLEVGMTIAGDGIPEGSVITAIDIRTNSVTLSKAIDTKTTETTSPTVSQTVTRSGEWTKGKAVVISENVAGLMVGMTVVNPAFPAGTVIKSISQEGRITLSSPATENGSGNFDLSGIKLNPYVALSGTWLKDSAVVTGANTAGLLPGMSMTNPAFPSGTVIESISADGKITLSKPATIDGSGDFQLVGLQTGTPLILSAGNSIAISKGSALNIATSLLDIYAAGTGFEAKGLAFSLLEKLTLETLLPLDKAARTPLVLDSVSIVNEWPLEKTQASAGVISMKAPSISIVDSMLSAGAVKIESFEGDVTLSRRGIKGTVETTASLTNPEVEISKITLESAADLAGLKVGQGITARVGQSVTALQSIPSGTTITKIEGNVLTLSDTVLGGLSGPLTAFSSSVLPLGITDPYLIAVSSSVLSVKSAGNLSIGNIPLFTIDSTFESGGALSLSGVTFIQGDTALEQTITATSKTFLKFEDTTASNVITTTLAAKEGALTLSDSIIGNPQGFLDSIPEGAASANIKTRFTAEAEKAALILQSITNSETGLHADSIEL